MRILFLSQLIPYPPDAGPKVRIYYVLKYLAAAGHDVTFVAFRRETDTAEAIEHLQAYCREVHTVLMQRSRLRDAWHFTQSVATGQPFLIQRDRVALMRALVKGLVERQPFDAIHADQLWMAQYALGANGHHSNGRPYTLVLDQHNAMHLIPQRMAGDTTNPLKRALLQFEARQLSRYELETCQAFDHVVWVSEEDRRVVRQRAHQESSGKSEVNGNGKAPQDRVIPICVDPNAKPPIARLHGACRVTFLGSLHWPPNAEGISWFAQEVWPIVQRQVPDALLTVIGKNPPAPLTALALENPCIEVTGYLGDPTPYLAETAVFIVPLSAGGGMRVKIIDAWTWGLPVVSTSIGAEGTRYCDGENLLIADDKDAFAEAVVCVLQQRALARRLAAAGRDTVMTYYNWRQVYQAWDAIYDTPV